MITGDTWIKWFYTDGTPVVCPVRDLLYGDMDRIPGFDDHMGEVADLRLVLQKNIMKMAKENHFPTTEGYIPLIRKGIRKPIDVIFQGLSEKLSTHHGTDETYFLWNLTKGTSIASPIKKPLPSENVTQPLFPETDRSVYQQESKDAFLYTRRSVETICSQVIRMSTDADPEEDGSDRSESKYLDSEAIQMLDNVPVVTDPEDSRFVTGGVFIIPTEDDKGEMLAIWAVPGPPDFSPVFAPKGTCYGTTGVINWRDIVVNPDDQKLVEKWIQSKAKSINLENKDYKNE